MQINSSLEKLTKKSRFVLVQDATKYFQEIEEKEEDFYKKDKFQIKVKKLV